MGSLGGVLVGLLVLVAVGGAYSLRSYPIPSFLSSGINEQISEQSQKAMIASLLEEACLQVLADSRQPNAEQHQAFQQFAQADMMRGALSPDQFKIMVAYFGSQQRGAGNGDIAELMRGLPSFVSERREILESPELLNGVNCTIFADNTLQLIEGTAAAMAGYDAMGMGSGMLGFSPNFNFLQISHGLNVFGMW
eukprot:CAMPEP_0184486262 /NCGR_PEP_ID=MMETSP0113_2-20130426/7772_1 /TAXON_ID=91329 /ORGANISM="Norrisiella sphaerica, Strain BC52" /LENGTH=193 /DNA_ID=CAMNT_0026868049 /DNA_START=277 /DNA_END=855 /DNA_ORIENTATION=-